MGDEVIAQMKEMYKDRPIKSHMLDSWTKTVSQIKEWINKIDDKVKAMKGKLNYLKPGSQKNKYCNIWSDGRVSELLAIRDQHIQTIEKKLGLDIAERNTNFIRRTGRKVEG